MKRNIKYQISNIKKKISWRIVIATLVLLGIYLIFAELRNSLFFQKKDRLNLVFYGENIAFYSFGLTDKVNYFISFPADIKMLVPGGFGNYRLGALGKLVYLEKKPELFKKTFSGAVGSFVDGYFYPRKDEVYFGGRTKSIFFPKLSQTLFLKSDIPVIDRLYVAGLFLTSQKNNFRQITDLPVKSEGRDGIFDEKKFYDRLFGFFYQQSYRTERMSVQILYTKNEKNAVYLSRIIEGQGIRVVDISYRPAGKKCQLVAGDSLDTKTAEALSVFFGCPKTESGTGPFDIILEIGEREEEWAIE